MRYDFIIIDSIICEYYLQIIYEESSPNKESLLKIQTKSASKIADKKEPLLLVTSETKETLEKKYLNGDIPFSLGCLLASCKEVDILCKDENDSIIKASSLLSWKNKKFCILTGNSVLRDKLASLSLNVFDLSQIPELAKEDK